ncbi:YceD family protein [Consotaella salsifontis]|uniref:Uncharacterized ACR, COG1399 n=1 Tax=Consotaella salsifontis TaxID=1365950 RepID=A0A1T4P4M7_9HYPH|nr:DUF177 domain-containing protein [Consotaella salsifontis]SJZ86464.1 Uncharacterized ACR, COG1399 [Consotaella salsifontis]
MSLSNNSAAAPIHVPVPGRPHRDKLSIAWEADQKALEALATYLDILKVESFALDLAASSWRGEGVRIEGRLTASVQQACVVTLEPVPQIIDEPVDAFYVPVGSKLAQRLERSQAETEVEVDPEGDETPEIFSGDTIDVGGLATEILAVALDPYPRAPGAAFEVEEDGEDDTVSPFAVLKGLGSGTGGKSE